MACSKRIDGCAAAIRVPRIIGLAHAGDERAQAAAVGEGSGIGEEQEIAAGNERGRKPLR